MTKNFNLNNYFRLFKLTAIIKNILIVIPPILAQVNLFEQADTIVLGILVFFIISSVCYITNDYTDKSSDKKNPLKKNNVLINKFSSSSIVLINLLLYIFLFLLSFTNLFGFSLVIYLSLFYLYNFVFKTIKYLDIFILILLHLLRLTYGIEIFELTASFWFIIFFIFLFLILASSKRIIQFNILKKSKTFNINKYNKNDIKLLFNIIKVTIFLNLVFFSLYFFRFTLGLNVYFDGTFTPIISNNLYLLIQFALFYFSLLRLYYSLKMNIISVDVYLFIIKDKIIFLMITIFVLMYLLFFLF